MLTLATSLPPHETRRLGRTKKRHDVRTLQFGKYLPKELPATPDVDDWSTKLTNIGSMLNTAIGDCGVAAPGHAEQVWTSLSGTQLIISDPVILAVYKAISGYNGTPATDVGVNMLDVLKFWRNPGIGGKKLKAFAEIKKDNREHIDFGIHGFGGIYAGLNLPKSCQNQVMWTLSPGGTDGDPTPGSWGGHAIWIVGKDKKRRTYKFISWGLLMEMSFDFWDVCGDECYACMPEEDWGSDTILSPSGYDVPTLMDDLTAVAA